MKLTPDDLAVLQAKKRDADRAQLSLQLATCELQRYLGVLYIKHGLTLEATIDENTGEITMPKKPQPTTGKIKQDKKK